jgi:hypothetical protein
MFHYTAIQIVILICSYFRYISGDILARSQRSRTAIYSPVLIKRLNHFMLKKNVISFIENISNDTVKWLIYILQCSTQVLFVFLNGQPLPGRI